MSMKTRNLAELVNGLNSGAVEDATRRSIRSHVDLQPADTADATIRLNLSVHHWKDRKEFGVTLSISEYSSEGVFAVNKHEPMNKAHNRRLPSIPAARYSSKAMNAAFVESIKTLKEDPAGWLAPLDLDVTSVAN